MIRRTVSILSATLVVWAGLTVTAPGAHAATVDYVEGYGGQVPYRACESFGFDWAATDDSGSADQWDATATLYKPSGGYSDAVDASGSGGYASDSGDFLVCWGEGAGTYEIVVDVTFYDLEGTEVDSGSGRGTLKITRQAPPTPPKQTRSLLSVSDRTPHFREHVTFTVRSQIRGSGGWRPNGGAIVGLAGRCSTPDGDSGWVALAKGAVNRHGVGYARFIYDIPSSWRCRYVSITLKTDTTKASVSRAVAVRTSGSASARVAAGRGSTPLSGAALEPDGRLSDLLG